MANDTRKPGDEKEIPAFGRDSIEMAMRQRIARDDRGDREEELDAALGAAKSARVGDDAPGLSARHPRADVDDESGADDDRHAAGARADGRGHEPPNGAARWCRGINAARARR